MAAKQKAADALAPFIALACSANSPRYAADLVVRATSHPGVFVFAELLYKPQIQALARAGPDYAAYLTLLQIFSYGTYADYVRGTAPPAPLVPSASSNASSPAAPLPPLTDVQARKLRQLSLLSCARNRASLSYEHLVRELHLTDVNSPATTADDAATDALEDLVRSAVYAELLTATLDPARHVVRISTIAPLRDPAPGPADLQRLHGTLSAWSIRCETALASIDAEIDSIRAAAAARAADERRRTMRIKRAVARQREGQSSNLGFGRPSAGLSRTKVT